MEVCFDNNKTCGDATYDMLVRDYRQNIPSIMEARFISLVNNVHDYLLYSDDISLTKITRNIQIILKKAYDKEVFKEKSFKEYDEDERFNTLMRVYTNLRQAIFQVAFEIGSKIASKDDIEASLYERFNLANGLLKYGFFENFYVDLTSYRSPSCLERFDREIELMETCILILNGAGVIELSESLTNYKFDYRLKKVIEYVNNRFTQKKLILGGNKNERNTNKNCEGNR